MSNYVLHAEQRTMSGKGASRRLRRLEEKMPAIIYGGNDQPESISLLHREVMRCTLENDFYGSKITLDFGDRQQEVMIQDMQHHPFKPIILHMDFKRTS